jgi:hypothetical protein
MTKGIIALDAGQHHWIVEKLAEHGDQVAGNVGHRDHPCCRKRRSDQEHDQCRRLRSSEEHFKEMFELQLLVDEHCPDLRARQGPLQLGVLYWGWRCWHAGRWSSGCAAGHAHSERIGHAGDGFGRLALVGLRGGWGSLQAGRLYTPYAATHRPCCGALTLTPCALAPVFKPKPDSKRKYALWPPPRSSVPRKPNRLPEAMPLVTLVTLPLAPPRSNTTPTWAMP